MAYRNLTLATVVVDRVRGNLGKDAFAGAEIGQRHQTSPQAPSSSPALGPRWRAGPVGPEENGSGAARRPRWSDSGFDGLDRSLPSLRTVSRTLGGVAAGARCRWDRRLWWWSGCASRCAGSRLTWTGSPRAALRRQALWLSSTASPSCAYRPARRCTCRVLLYAVRALLLYGVTVCAGERRAAGRRCVGSAREVDSAALDLSLDASQPAASLDQRAGLGDDQRRRVGPGECS